MRSSGVGSFNSQCQASPPPLVSTATTPEVKRPNSARKGLLYTLNATTLSTGTVTPKLPVAGSVASSESTSREFRCSAASEITSLPSGVRTTPGMSGRASLSVAGRSGAALTSRARRRVAGGRARDRRRQLL